jgi:type II secretory pathway pseudopilin PulG
MNKGIPNNHRRGEAGFTLIEMTITMVGFVIVTMMLANIVMVGAMTHEMTQTKNAAMVAADTALDSLVRQPLSAFSVIPASFTLNADNTITLTGQNCSSTTCDMVLTPETDLPLNQKTSIAAGVRWLIVNTSGAPPAGSVRRFVRRWRVDTVDSALGLRRITVVVLRDTTSTEPLAVASELSDVVMR